MRIVVEGREYHVAGRRIFLKRRSLDFGAERSAPKQMTLSSVILDMKAIDCLKRTERTTEPSSRGAVIFNASMCWANSQTVLSLHG